MGMSDCGNSRACGASFPSPHLDLGLDFARQPKVGLRLLVSLCPKRIKSGSKCAAIVERFQLASSKDSVAHRRA